jgi:glucose-1-phosphate thymidylyltransferase
MKGVILAGGTGSRLYPLTKVTNKALLPMGRQPVISHVLSVLTMSDITDIMIITGTEHMGSIVNLLGSGAEYGCDFTYKVQEKPNGIAAAVGMCENFVGEDRFVTILGDNIFENVDEVANCIKAFANSQHEYGLVIKEVPDPQRFGVVSYPNSLYVEDKMSIVEKPKRPPSSDAVLGLYMYTSNVFDIIKGLKPSARGEYEISDVNNELVQNEIGNLYRIHGDWIDAGTHESYERANDMLRQRDHKLQDDVALVRATIKEF